MRFALSDLTGKGAYLAQKLVAAGHTQVGRIDETDVLLVDCDWRWAHPRPEMIRSAHEAGVLVVLYPHAGLPTCFVYDGLTDPDEHVALRLEHGPGSLEMADAFGGVPNQHATGWLFSPTSPFRPVKEPRTVLFAPQHPNIEALQTGSNGHDPAPVLNQRIYRMLLQTDLEVVVSFVGPEHRNGVWPHPRARFVGNHAMSFPASFDLVQQADIIVGTGTILALAVALGKPAVGFGHPDCGDYIDGEYRYATHADELTDMSCFPLDATEDDDLDRLLERACDHNDAVTRWRKQWVGSDGTQAAIRLIGGLDLPERASRNVTIQGATASVAGGS